MHGSTLKLNSAESQALEKALDAIFQRPETANLIFSTGAERRAANRCRLKLKWARTQKEAKA